VKIGYKVRYVTLLLCCIILLPVFLLNITGDGGCSSPQSVFVHLASTDFCVDGSGVRLVGTNSYGILLGYLSLSGLKPSNSTFLVDTAGLYHLRMLRFWTDPSFFSSGLWALYNSSASHSAYFTGFASLADDAKKNNVLLVPSLVTVGDGTWEKLTGEPVGFFYMVGSRTNLLFKNYWVAPIVNRFKNMPQVAWWELGNEQNCCNLNKTEIARRIAWAKDLNAFIKKLDPSHLTEGGWNNSGSLNMTEFDNYNSFEDVSSIHIYSDTLYSLERTIGITDNRTAINDFVSKYFRESENVLGKPLFIGEFNAANSDGNTTAYNYDNWIMQAVYTYDSGAMLVWDLQADTSTTTCSNQHVSPRCTPWLMELLLYWSDQMTASP